MGRRPRVFFVGAFCREFGSTPLGFAFTQPPFSETFRVESSEVEKLPITQIVDGQWNAPELRALLEEVLKKDPQKRLQASFELPGVGKRQVHINAHRLVDGNGQPSHILLTLQPMEGA